MSTRDTVLIALFAALMAVLGAFPPLMLPIIAIPVTAQSMGPMLMGGILGAKRGVLSMLLFLLLVLIGLPFLSGGRGGLAPFVGPWSGFIFGWIAASFVIGWMVERSWARLGPVSAFGICVLGGIGVVYLVGVPWFAVFSGVSPLTAFMSSAIAFIPGDLVKAALATAAIIGVKRAYPLIAPRSPANVGV